MTMAAAANQAGRGGDEDGQRTEDTVFPKAPSWTIDARRALDPAGYLREFTSKSSRPDGRSHRAVRPTTVVKGVLPRNAYGSALVRLGDTQVLAAVTLAIGTPGAASPEFGDVEVRLTVGPLCSPNYNLAGRPVPPQEAPASSGGGGCLSDPDAIESLVQRTVRTSGLIDHRQLSVERGKSAWRVRVGVTALNDDGNLLDATMLGAVAALADVRLPRTRVEDDGGAVRTVPGPNPNVCAEGGKRLRLGDIPVPLTCGNFDGTWLADPCALEEGLCHSSITAVATSGGAVAGLTKLGRRAASAEEVAACIAMAVGRAKELVSILREDQGQPQDS